MNIWMDIAIALMVTNAALLVLEFWILLLLSRCKAANAVLIGYEGENELLHKTAKSWEARAHELEDERNDLREQLNQSSKESAELYNRIRELVIERDGLQKRLDEVLKPRDVEVKPRRSRAKPSAQEANT